MDRLIKQNLTGQTNLDWDLAGKQFLTIEDNVPYHTYHQRGFLFDD